jgi:hypothetical protein
MYAAAARPPILHNYYMKEHKRIGHR